MNDSAPSARGTAVALKTEIEARMEDYRPLLPPHVPPERFVRVLLTALAKNPDLIAADRRSLLNACLDAAKDGLPPDGRLSALVIYNEKNKAIGTVVKKVQYQRMVGGYRDLAARAGCHAIYARVVFAADRFAYREGIERSLMHEPAMGDRGAPIGAYAVAKFGDGREPDWLWLSWAEIAKRRAASRAQSPAAPWAQWTNEMAEKTVVKALCADLMLVGPEAERLREDDADNEPRDITPERPRLADFAEPADAPPAAAEPAIEHDPDTGELFDGAAAEHMAAIAGETPAPAAEPAAATPARSYATEQDIVAASLAYFTKAKTEIAALGAAKATDLAFNIWAKENKPHTTALDPEQQAALRGAFKAAKELAAREDAK